MTMAITGNNAEGIEGTGTAAVAISELDAPAWCVVASNGLVIGFDGMPYAEAWEIVIEGGAKDWTVTTINVPEVLRQRSQAPA
jgi:hypothetical protein